jgi:hypothetical protein
MCRDWFVAMDANGDEKVSFVEWVLGSYHGMIGVLGVIERRSKYDWRGKGI